jgi:site-specific DNA-adenine methylase
MKNHFVFSYAGNKRQECEYIYNNLNFTDIDTIVEPFCGSSAFSFYCYHYKGLKNVKYILNDIDKNLINLYNLCKDYDYYDYKNKLDDELFNDDKFITKEEYLKIIKKNDFKAYITRNLYCRIRPGLYNTELTKPKKVSCHDFINFLKNANVEILNADGVEVVNKYENKKNTLIFSDPPYLSLCNDYYNIGNGEKNIYEYVLKNNFYEKKAYIVFVLNESWITKFIFKNWHIIKYDKKYQPTKREVIHLLITNKKNEPYI